MLVAFSLDGKVAVIGLTTTLARELGPSNINVNCIAPGLT
jgi:3-oxoacyl-[acyl-carrier protein] reductase